MATTVEASAPESTRPRLVAFGKMPKAIPIHPGPMLQWGLFVLMVANLGRIPVLSTGDRNASIVLNDVFAVALVSFGIVAAVLRRSLLVDAVGAFGLAFAAIGFGSALAAIPRFDLAPWQLIISLAYLARWLVYFGIYFFIVNNVQPSQVSVTWKALVKVMMVFAAFGVFQSLFLPDFAQLVYPESRARIDWDPQGHRLVSTVLDPNIAGAMIILVLLVQLAQISTGVRIKPWQPGLLLVALAMTLSRSSILALMSGLIVIVVARGISLRMIRLFGAIAFLSTAVLPTLIKFASTYSRFSVGSGSSADARVFVWLVALKTVAAHPIIGVGFNTYGYVKQRMGIQLLGASAYGSEGGLLFAAVMTGIVGLVFYLCMLGAIIRRCRRIWRDVDADAESRGFAIGTAAGVVAICVHSIFANSLFTTFVMELLWVMWGLTYVIAKGRTSSAASRSSFVTR